MSLYIPSVANIRSAAKRLSQIMEKTPLHYNVELSEKNKSHIFLKREDTTQVRSYKIRGAYNRISSTSAKEIVSCSAGNHAQGVAYSCKRTNKTATIFMPTITSRQKIDRVKKFGGGNVNIRLVGSSFDQAFEYAKQYSVESKAEFIHPFDDEKVIEGQGTVGYEIIEQMFGAQIDYIVLPVGGGGLAAGVSAYIKELSPKTKIIGVEPTGAPSMTEAFKANRIISLDEINTFVDGAAVKQVGYLNFPICQKYLDEIIRIDESHVCSKIIEMYSDHGYVLEPAGVLSLCALDNLSIENKSVVCIVSGGNADIHRIPEIIVRSFQ